MPERRGRSATHAGWCGTSVRCRLDSDGEQARETETLPLAIIGGGLGGLSLANALQIHNQRQRGLPTEATCGRGEGGDAGAESRHAVGGRPAGDEQAAGESPAGGPGEAGAPAGTIPFVVFERDIHFHDRKQGYGLTLSAYNQSGPMYDLNILDECLANNCASHRHWVFGKGGEILGYFGRGLDFRPGEQGAPPAAEGGGEKSPTGGEEDRGRQKEEHACRSTNLRVPRQVLRQVLLDRLPAERVVWGKKLVRILESSEPADGAERHAAVKVVTLCFADGSEYRCAGVVGADGLRSFVREERDRLTLERTRLLGSPLRQGVSLRVKGLNYLGVSVIIGLSALRHPLIHQGGFYVLEGKARLFIMPFSGTLTMWQLSFSGEHVGTEREALDFLFGPAARDRRLNAGAALEQQRGLLEKAEALMQDWFGCCLELVRHTEPEAVWGTPIYDRAPADFFDPVEGVESQLPEQGANDPDEAEPDDYCSTTSSEKPAARAGKKAAAGAAAMRPSITKCPRDRLSRMDPDSCITLLGDAAHPMSMFKGQGANQALLDGPLLTKWLTKKCPPHFSLGKRLRHFEREMMQRVEKNVLASREAARKLHGIGAAPTPATDVELAVSLGDRRVCDEVLEASGSAGAFILDELRRQGVSASDERTHRDLERRIRRIVEEKVLVADDAGRPPL